ncbi:hypothetical protein QX51_02795 [Terrisporobacter othiniensis]|uniref:Uncharacterized protein n=1 Tax=Terrisporobacter othiniensis TaxID=1577792 RepID=A0A0B3W077_9FIRM|nr:zinc ribbon domain-containing protein [Terrisporobacter othiniensis]KHS58443.1 hypothetical protein QX51_02795 [Terrisporobacter othiniensis]
MSDRICKECGFDNDSVSKYCQKCGSFLTQKKSLKKFVESLNFGSIAGAGAKGTSMAPLAGIELDKNNRENECSTNERVRKSYYLEDGSWYCPYCGKKNNKQAEFFCGDCLREKP